jgi:hypothetical protein
MFRLSDPEDHIDPAQQNFRWTHHRESARRSVAGMSEHKALGADRARVAAAAHAQSQAVAAAEHEGEDQAFVDGLSWDIARDD